MKNEAPLPLRPHQLMCLACRSAARPADVLLDSLRRNPARPIQLLCVADSVYAFACSDTPAESPAGERFREWQDLLILQRLGLVPGDTRPAIDLFERLFLQIPAAPAICGTGSACSATWQGCPLAESGAYEQAVASGPDALLPRRTAEEKIRAKRDSVAAIRAADVLSIRPHHLLCLSCFHRGRAAADIAPIQEDNLAEVIHTIQARPDLPIRLVRGCCMICPPCSRYEPDTNRCLGGRSMALRDQFKDLAVLRALGLDYGALLPARDLLRRLYDAIRSTTEICGYGDGVARSPEWSVCGGPDGNHGYPLARAMGLGVPGAAP